MTNTMNRCKTGIRRLNRPLNRMLNRFATRMLEGRTRPAPPNYLRQAVAILRPLVKEHERKAREFPDLFDYAHIERQRAERQTASERFLRDLNHVYGPSPS